MRKKKILYFTIIVIAFFLLNGCAFLLNQLLSETNQRQYTAHVYFTGIPKEIIDRANDLLLRNITITDFSSIVNFSIGEPPVSLREDNILYLTNGLNKSSAFTFTAPESDKVNIEMSLNLRYATDTTIGTYSVNMSIGKSEYTLPNNSKSFYVLIDMTDSVSKSIKLLEYSKGYKFIIRTSNEEFVRIYDGQKFMYLFTKNISGNNECVFVGERGKIYTFESLATYVSSIRTAPLDTSIGSEIVELK